MWRWAEHAGGAGASAGNGPHELGQSGGGSGGLRGEGLGRGGKQAAGRRGKRELGQAGWVAGLPGLDLFGFWNSPMSFLFQTNTNLSELKFKFEFTTSTQTTRTMLQHECIKLNLRKKFNYL